MKNGRKSQIILSSIVFLATFLLSANTSLLAQNIAIERVNNECSPTRTVNSTQLRDIASFVRENKITFNPSVNLAYARLYELRLPCDTSISKLYWGSFLLSNGDLYGMRQNAETVFEFRRHVENPPSEYNRTCLQHGLENRPISGFLDCVDTSRLPDDNSNIFAAITKRYQKYSVDYYRFGAPARKARRILSTNLEIAKIGYMPAPHGLGKGFNILLSHRSKVYLFTFNDEVENRR